MEYMSFIIAVFSIVIGVIIFVSHERDRSRLEKNIKELTEKLQRNLER